MVVTTEGVVLMWGRGFYGTKAERSSPCGFVASTWQDHDIVRDSIVGITERKRPTQTNFNLDGSCAKEIWFSSSELIADWYTGLSVYRGCCIQSFNFTLCIPRRLE